MPNKTQEGLIAEMHTDIKWLKNFMECADKRYAKKWVEKLGVGLVSTILVIVIGAIMGLLLVPHTVAYTQLFYNFIT